MSTQLRRPVAAVAAGEWLFVANRESGSISVIDRSDAKVIGEKRIGERLSDLATVNGRYLLATDEQRHQLILLERRGGTVHVAQRLPVAPYPVSVSVTNDGTRCTVASLWSRRLSFVDIAGRREPESHRSPRLVVRGTLDLPFAPRKQQMLNEGRLLVADSFGGRFATVDVRKRKLLAVHSIPGHNIRGLAVSHDGRNLLVTHQMLDEEHSTTYEGVFWGGVMLNLIRALPMEKLLSSEGDEEITGTIHPLGRPSTAAGDPAGILVTSEGTALVALAGVDELAIRPGPQKPFIRRKVGRHPTALTTGPDERRAYAVNTFGDSVSVVDLQEKPIRVNETISLGPQPELTAADRGELLFHDARLSLDGWYSCHSCHTDGHTTGLLNDNFGDGSFGAPKRVLSLRGAGKTGPWAWNGSAGTLHAQIEKSIRVTMQGRKLTDASVRDLAAYIRSLPPAPSVEKLRNELDRQAVKRGRQVFNETGCADCHQPPTYTSPATYEVGLTDEAGNTQFNPPSLRGLSQRDAFFHDNRATKLREVFTRFGHAGADTLTPQQLDNLLAFLRSL